MASIDDIFGKEMMQKINEEQKKSDDTKLSDGSPLPFDKIVDKYIPPNRRPWHADDTLDLVNNKSMKNLEQIDEHKKDQNSSLISKSIIDNNLENSLDVQFIDDIEYPEGENEESIKELILNKFNEITED